MKKKYIFWKEVQKTVKEECIIEANSLDEATKLHNDGVTDYKEIDSFNEEIIDEGTIESEEN